MEATKVEDVVGDFVNLKRRGVNMIGLCPFHNEKTPSFIVSPSKNIYKCFGCGKAGDGLRFVMEHENYSYPEGLRFLAEKYGIEIEETATSQEAMEERQHLDSLFVLNQYASDWYADQLWKTDYGKSIGLGYFKDRGFREETIRKWGLGYAPEKKDAFILSAVHDGYSIDRLKDMGLANQYGRDFFRGRVMFPIRNLSGKVVAFGGRILAKDAKAAKYLNSPDTEIYNKSRILYGAHFARTPIRKEGKCIVVEGYTDVISLHQSGIENVVAPCGTSLTPDQVRVIKRYTPNVTFLFDGDAAGKKAALRGLDMVLELDMNVKVVMLPEGEDPDSYLQNVGVQKFNEFIEEQGKDFIFFKTATLMEEVRHDPVRKTEVIRDVISSIAKIPDPIKRSLFIKECSVLMDVEERLLTNEINKGVAKKIKEQKKKRTTEALPDPVGAEAEAEDLAAAITEKEAAAKSKELTDEFQEKDILRILVEAGDKVMDEESGMTVAAFILSDMDELLPEFDNPTYADLIKACLKEFNAGRTLGKNFFLHHSDPKVSDLAVNLITSPFDYSYNWDEKLQMPLQTQEKPEDNFTKDTLQSVYRFKLRKVLKLLKKNQSRLKDAQAENDMSKMMGLLKVQKKLTDMKQELASFFGSVIL